MGSDTRENYGALSNGVSHLDPSGNNEKPSPLSEQKTIDRER